MRVLASGSQLGSRLAAPPLLGLLPIGRAALVTVVSWSMVVEESVAAGRRMCPEEERALVETRQQSVSAADTRVAQSGFPASVRLCFFVDDCCSPLVCWFSIMLSFSLLVSFVAAAAAAGAAAP